MNTDKKMRTEEERLKAMQRDNRWASQMIALGWVIVIFSSGAIIIGFVSLCLRG